MFSNKTTITNTIDLKEKLKELKDSFDLNVAKPFEQAEKPGEHHIIFTLNNELFAWPIAKVKDALINQKIISIPSNVLSLYGVVNYKNQVISVTNLHYILLGIRGIESNVKNILLVTKGLAIDTAFFVDGLKGIAPISEYEIKEKPATVSTETSELIKGIYYYKTQLITILKYDRFSG
ncbi:MAG: chemotaxis protein CheW [Desulfobacterales bacterium]|nr:chemotaxis protein CheW [Desulfobacterales bacterium]